MSRDGHAGCEWRAVRHAGETSSQPLPRGGRVRSAKSASIRRLVEGDTLRSTPAGARSLAVDPGPLSREYGSGRSNGQDRRRRRGVGAHRVCSFSVGSMSLGQPPSLWNMPMLLYVKRSVFTCR